MRAIPIVRGKLYDFSNSKNVRKVLRKTFERHPDVFRYTKRYTYVLTFARESVIRSVILRNASRCKMAEIRVGDFTRTKFFS